jgi:hypothetical protein
MRDVVPTATDGLRQLSENARQLSLFNILIIPYSCIRAYIVNKTGDDFRQKFARKACVGNNSYQSW